MGPVIWDYNVGISIGGYYVILLAKSLLNALLGKSYGWTWKLTNMFGQFQG